MKATLILYIVMGALFLVPLILFNIRRIFVRKPPAPLKINWGRGLFVVLFSAFLVFFLVCAYRTTMESRYEIAAERIAEQHASMPVSYTHLIQALRCAIPSHNDYLTIIQPFTPKEFHNLS